MNNTIDKNEEYIWVQLGVLLFDIDWTEKTWDGHLTRKVDFWDHRWKIDVRSPSSSSMWLGLRSMAIHTGGKDWHVLTHLIYVYIYIYSIVFPWSSCMSKLCHETLIAPKFWQSWTSLSNLTLHFSVQVKFDSAHGQKSIVTHKCTTIIGACENFHKPKNRVQTTLHKTRWYTNTTHLTLPVL